MHLQLWRHATLLARLAEASFLIDPMLSPASAWEPVRNSANPRRNPLVDLPLEASQLAAELGRLRAVFVTHTHADHWDRPAIDLLSKDLPIFCQPEDADQMRTLGFGAAQPVASTLDWDGLRVHRTDGRHGRGEIADRIGPVSGFVLAAAGEPVLYIAGDTVWCPEVEAALRSHRPEVIVVNAGAAQFLDSDPITMDANDVLAVARAAPSSRVVAVHFETINHCGLSREALRRRVAAEGLEGQVLIPADGEVLVF